MDSEQNGKHDPSDDGAPRGAPRPIKPTPEVIAMALQGIDEEQIAEDIREIRAGRGLKLEDFIGELEEIARQTSEPAVGRG